MWVLLGALWQETAMNVEIVLILSFFFRYYVQNWYLLYLRILIELFLNEEEVVKKVKVFKNVSQRVENLKNDVLLTFFESSFLNNQYSFFTSSCFCFVTKTCNLCSYLVLLVFLGVFNQTCATKLEIYLCFSFSLHHYVFWKTCYGYHGNNRIDTSWVLESLLTVLSENIYFLWSICQYRELYVSKEQVLKKLKLSKKLSVEYTI